MSDRSGGYCWYELMTNDVAGATAFYGKVLGWNLADSGMPGLNYTLAKVGDSPVGGLMTIPEAASDTGANPCWLGYIAVPDVDAYAEKVEAGGAVHREPCDIPGVGRFSIVADPQGAVFVLFRGEGTPPERPPYMTPGTVGWHELHAKDWEQVFDFYAGLFGWQKNQPIPMGEMGTYQLLGKGRPEDFGAMFNDAQAERPFWLYYFAVADIDEASARVTDAGGAIAHGPMEVPGSMWVVHVRDPQGALFALVGRRPAT